MNGLMKLWVQGNRADAFAAGLKRRVMLVPYLEQDGVVVCFTMVRYADEVIKWRKEWPDNKLFQVQVPSGTLIDYSWPEDN